MFDHVSRLDDLKQRARETGDDWKKRAATTGDDLVRRAIAASDDLIQRARDARDGLAERASDGSGAVAQRARIQRDILLSRAQTHGEDLYDRGRKLVWSAADGLPARVRSVLPHKPTPMEETRSFLSSPAVAIAGAVAIGVVAGVVLTLGRKAAVQGAEALHGDWLEVLKAEHKQVDRLFEQLMRTTEKQTIRRAFLLNRIAHALSKHAMQEEMVVYPALQEANSNGQAMHLYEDHAQIKIFIHELNEISKSDPLWIERARAFRDALREHVREEEDEIYPPYHDRMSPQQNRHLTVGLHKEGLKLA